MATAVAKGPVRSSQKEADPPQPPSPGPSPVISVKSSSDSDPPLPLAEHDYSHYDSKVTIDNFELLKVSSLFLPIAFLMHRTVRKMIFNCAIYNPY
jgi:hypothetical protein